MREGYGSHSVCVCLSDSVLTPTYLVYKAQVRSFMAFYSFILCAENALLKSSGVICWSLLPSSLLDDLLMDKRDNIVVTQYYIP